MTGVGHQPPHSEPAPVFDHPHSTRPFAHVQSEPALVQLCAIPTHPVISSHWFFSSAVTDRSEIAPWPPPLHTIKPKCHQPFLTACAFQLLYQLYCPPLDALQHPNELFILWNPELHKILQVKLWQWSFMHSFRREVVQKVRYSEKGRQTVDWHLRSFLFCIFLGGHLPCFWISCIKSCAAVLLCFFCSAQCSSLQPGNF